jgi:hypothetical protein
VRARLAIETQPPVRRRPRHERLPTLVERMLELNKKTSVAPPSGRHSRQDAGATLPGKLAPSQVDRVDREMYAADAEIGKLVCELDSITDEVQKTTERPHHQKTTLEPR